MMKTKAYYGLRLSDIHPLAHKILKSIAGLWFFTSLLSCGGGGGGGTPQAMSLLPRERIIESFSTRMYINEPKLMAFNNHVLYVANSGGNNVVKIDTSGQQSLFNFDAGLSFSNPIGLSFNTSGELYVSFVLAGSATIRRFTSSGHQVPTFRAYSTTGHYGIVLDANNSLYQVDTTNGLIKDGVLIYGAGNEGYATGFAGVAQRNSLVYVTNQSTNEIKVIDASNQVTTLQLSGKTLSRPHGLAFDTEGNLFVVNYGSQSDGSISSVSKLVITGQTAVVTEFASADSAGLCASVGAAIGDGFIYVSNGNCSLYPTRSNRIQRIELKVN